MPLEKKIKYNLLMGDISPIFIIPAGLENTILLSKGQRHPDTAPPQETTPTKPLPTAKLDYFSHQTKNLLR